MDTFVVHDILRVVLSETETHKRYRTEKNGEKGAYMTDCVRFQELGLQMTVITQDLSSLLD